MNKLICPKCMAVHFVEGETDGSCPVCHLDAHHVNNFRNSDEFLEKEIPRVLEERNDLDLQGLVGGLSFVIINTEPDRQREAVAEFLRYTGFVYSDGFEDDSYRTCVNNRNLDSLPFRQFSQTAYLSRYILKFMSETDHTT